jgi:hypothetical protein
VIARPNGGTTSPLLTLWQEQRMALSGSTRGAGAAPTSPPAGRAAAGAAPPRSGSTAAAARNRPRPPPGWRRAGDCLAVGHQLLVDAVDPVQQLLGAGGTAWASPMEPTSTPSA